MKTPSSLHLTETAMKLILYLQTALAGGGEGEKKKTKNQSFSGEQEKAGPESGVRPELSEIDDEYPCR